MKTYWSIVTLLLFVGQSYAQPFTRIDLTELESPPDTSLVHFITTEGDTATYTVDVASIDSTGRVFTIVIGSDTLQFEDQTGTGGTAQTLSIDSTGRVFTISISDTASDVTFEDTDTQLSDEQVQDVAGAMFSGNTETRITVTYLDLDGTIDLEVDGDLANYDNTNSDFATNTALQDTASAIRGDFPVDSGWLGEKLPAGNVDIAASDNDFRITDMNYLQLDADTLDFGSFLSNFRFPDGMTARWQGTTNYLADSETWSFRPATGTFPFMDINNSNDQVSLNGAIVNADALFAPGWADDTPPGDGYIGYANTDSTLSVYYSGAWRQLAWRDEIPSITASNGLTKTGDDVQLGGTLTANTSIDGSSNTYTLDFVDMLDIRMSANDSISLQSDVINMGTPGNFLEVNLPNTVNDIEGSQRLRLYADDQMIMQLTDDFDYKVDMSVARGNTVINDAFTVLPDGFFRPQTISIVPNPSSGDVGYMGYDSSSEELVMWDGTAWVAIGGTGGGSGGAFSTTSNVTSNSPGDLANDDFVFGSDQLDDDGTNDKRLYFDKSKASFSAGEWTGTEADDANRGSNTTNLSRNSITSSYASAAIGGQENTMQASGATAVGCNDCEGNGNYSVHFGRDARSSLEHDLVQGGGGDAKAGHHQFRRVIAWNDFTGTGTAQMYVNGSSSLIEIPNNTMWGGKIECSAVVSVAGTGTSVGDMRFYEGAFYARNISGTISSGLVEESNSLLASGGFTGAGSEISLSNDSANDAITLELTNIPGSAGSETSCTCTLNITESGY